MKAEERQAARRWIEYALDPPGPASGDRNKLVENYVAVLDPLRDAENKLRGIYPHGRDYQTHPEALAVATGIQEQRAARLRRLIDEIENEAVAISRL